jgi:phenylalanyl-tRNA synthetase beta subunit
VIRSMERSLTNEEINALQVLQLELFVMCDV